MDTPTAEGTLMHRLAHLGEIPGVNSGVLGVFKGARNAAVYGARVRFAHGLVMALLFRSGPWSQRLKSILKLTYEHASTLASFAFVYKGVKCLLANLLQIKEKRVEHAFIAGWIGGYLVWGKDPSSLLTQVNMYIWSRICFGLTQTVWDQYDLSNPFGSYESAFRVWAALCWAFVMFLFEYDRKNQNKSMTGSMVYIYEDSDKWSSIWDFLPTFKQA
uniref:Peroxisomal membrane protein 4 n=1 Tax=Paramoeba aestuarina TaxID=180227 RepID=A0A7S4URV4_9EUKA|mmetsp:Transcript_7894/g.11921  ORF Transcript_7894/g.11921 Transcript_7894/m.11921 type:complete len:217 (+) Transcript_7894:1-651(+)